jgi:hypothetical protein
MLSEVHLDDRRDFCAEPSSEHACFFVGALFGHEIGSE